MFNIAHNRKKPLFFYCSGGKGVQELNLGIQFRICNIPIILKNIEIPYRDFHRPFQFFPIVSPMRS